jgi:L-aspartate oxidase
VAAVLTRHVGPVYLDTRRVEEIAVRFPKLWATCLAERIDVARIPVRPGLHFHMGGVRVDENGSTSVAGLYAVGEVADTGVHGMNRLASNSLLECWVFGKRVAASVRLEEGPFTAIEVTAYALSQERFQAYRRQLGNWLTISPEFGEMRSFLESTQQLARTKHVTRQLAERTLQLEAGRMLALALLGTEEFHEQDVAARTAHTISN